MPFRAFLLVLLASLPLPAATLPPDFTETQLARGIVRPTAMALAPDGRIFVCEQTGALRVIKNGQLLPQPFVTVPVFTEGERGLLGVTVDPDFPRTPHVYVYYTAVKPFVHNRVSRFTAAGDRAASGSETAILDLPLLAKPIHNGGAMHFGPDGRLYVAVGENAVPENAQSLGNPLGKILRIEKDGSIPSDNPFPGSAIWAYGLRNPFSFAFQPSTQPGTGRMFINDVGRKDWEEINEGEAGANYGWPVTEGPTTNPAYRAPLYAYRHGPTPATGCAISGGAFYDPAEEQFPSEYLGTYFFADFCSGWIRRLDPATRTAHAFATDIGGPIGLQVGDDGSLYYLAYEDGTVSRIDYTGSPAPRITAQPEDLKVTLGAAATFTVGASGAPPLRYQWRRNGVDVPGGTSPSHTLKAEESAVFDVVVANDHGSVTSDPATLTVVTDQPPVPHVTVSSPLYQGGQTIAYSGEAADPEDGPLPASALTWRIDFHHADHFHPFVPEASGAEGTFTVPTIGETSPDVWFRVHLTAKDSAGLTGTTFVDVLPRKVRLTFLTDPPGLQVLLDGTPRTTPFTEEAVVGLTRTIGAAEPVSWSDGGAAVHEIATPAVDTTYTATFRAPRHGLMATYFDDRNLSQPVLTRVDPNVDFHWGLGSPAPNIGKDTFSVRWTGRIEAKATGPHTFLVRADNAARLWIDGQLLLDRGRIQLEAGKSYDLRLEYSENKGAAMVQLLWSAPGARRQVVPESQLTP